MQSTSLKDRIFNFGQLSPEWFNIRLAKVTASNLKSVMATLKRGGEAAERTNYRLALIAELMTWQSRDGFVSKEMEWGTEHEKDAREAFFLDSGINVRQVGFIAHPTIDKAGCSPDGLLIDDEGSYIGGLEIKCPSTEKHLRWIISEDEVPEEHYWQCIMGMACSELPRWDFVSYDPRVIFEPMRYYHAVLTTDNPLVLSDIAKANDEISSFISTVDIALANIAEHYGVTPDEIFAAVEQKKLGSSTTKSVEEHPETYLTDDDLAII